MGAVETRFNSQFLYYPKKFAEFNYESSGPFWIKEIGNGLRYRSFQENSLTPNIWPSGQQ
jgi:hypothetical protein